MSFEIKTMTKDLLDEMVAEHKRLNPDLPINEHIKASLDRYAHEGIPLGDFLTAVVSNDLFEALARADSYNRATIHQISTYIYNSLPSNCWGSPERVLAHYRSFKVADGEE